MWKSAWVVGIALTIGTVITMAREQHSAREKYEATRQKDCVSLALTSEDKHTCDKEAQSRKDYAPWWYVLVAWPEGIGIWAVIGTGFLIGWQSNETRKAAKATRDSVELVVKKERARLSIELLPVGEGISGDVWWVQFKVENHGSTHAFNVSLYYAYDVIAVNGPQVHPGGITRTGDIPSVVKTSETRFTAETFPGARGMDDEISLQGVQDKRSIPQITGWLDYEDVFGLKRVTQFRFVRVADFEEEGPEDYRGLYDLSGWRRPPKDNWAN
jgi:hypothetical protein